MELKKLTIEKIIRDSGVKSDGTGWERTEVVMRDRHSQIETSFIARVQKRVIDAGTKFCEGEEWDVGINVSTHEYQGKYYNDLSIWSMTPSAF